MPSLVFLLVWMFAVCVVCVSSSPLSPHAEGVLSGRESDVDQDVLLDVNHQAEKATEATEHDAMAWKGGKPEPKQPVNHDKRTKGPGCHREDMIVNFADIGMNGWVVAPEAYNAYRCTGKCTLPRMRKTQRTTNHAIMELVTRGHQMNHEGAAKHHGPCCTPTKLSSLSILTMEKGKIVLNNFVNMVVEECGCQ